jgi:hypothetical protein
MTIVERFVKKNIKGFHYCYKMELDDLDNKFTKFNIVGDRPRGPLKQRGILT